MQRPDEREMAINYRSARNGYVVVMILLTVLVWEEVLRTGSLGPLTITWSLGIVVSGISNLYYRRRM